MKFTYTLSLFFITLLFFTITGVVFAQFQSDSNVVKTKIGNPKEIDATDCPIPQGNPTCGSSFTPLASCGHCGLNYGSSAWCEGPLAYESIKYAMDIGGGYGQTVYLPKIKGDTIDYTFLGEQSSGDQSIQRYAGTDKSTGEQYYIQFHHTQPGTATKGSSQSGAVAATICQNCNPGTGPHVHIEFGSGGASGTTWLDAPKYFCKK